jgi:hypothetical protein
VLCSFLCNCIDMQHLTDVQASRCWICNFEVLNLCCVTKCSSLMELLLGVCRFVSTSVTSVHQMENGFNIWSFNGKLLYRLSRDRFFQVCLLNLAMQTNAGLIDPTDPCFERFLPWFLVPGFSTLIIGCHICFPVQQFCKLVFGSS